ncbi:hypothetical protein QBC36DRAFT_200671, partial [Triangularia setosa]
LLYYAATNLFYHVDKAQGFGIGQPNFHNSIEITRYTFLSNYFQPHEVRQHSLSVGLLYLLAEKDCPNLCKKRSTVHYIELGTKRPMCPLFAARATGSDSAV